MPEVSFAVNLCNITVFRLTKRSGLDVLSNYVDL